MIVFFWLLLVAPFFLGGFFWWPSELGYTSGIPMGVKNWGINRHGQPGALGGLGLWMMLSLSKSPARSGQNALCQKAALGWMYLVRGRRLG